MYGQLLTTDFLRQGIRETHAWQVSHADFDTFREAIASVFTKYDAGTDLNEAQTEDEIILPVLAALGWGQFLRQQTANRSGRVDVPDFLLFADADAKRKATSESKPDRRYRHGSLIVEAKRWGRPLDRGNATDHLEAGTPSNQMLRYLSRVEVASDRVMQYGILTNGGEWRLYWQGARSRSEQFIGFDLATLAGVAGMTADLFAPTDENASLDELYAFYLLFRREAFLAQADDADGRSFHAIARDESSLWESRVSRDLGARVFDDLFPRLAAAIARHDPKAASPYSRAYLEDVRRASMIVLYRLLFVLYAEDRNLLPVNDKRYDDYSLRSLRQNIARRVDTDDIFSATATRAWQHLRSLFRAIDKGDDSIGLPPYNGGLFHQGADDLLARIELPDAELAPILDGLSRKPGNDGLAWINYRDLAVQQLGSIYERLLEQMLVEADNGDLVVQPSRFARKTSGSYYTHDDLVKLILRETFAPLLAERTAAFAARVAALKRKRNELDDAQIIHQLSECDPAEALLDLTVCDPAMGSGHFLVSLVDHLADLVLEQVAEASAQALEAGLSDYYQSHLAHRISDVRMRILANARAGGWQVQENLLDDRHLVRRMILKRVVHGVDKNPMAVELAKLALWLHTFTVGAPLSFLDHHLRCGDSLYGERIGEVRLALGGAREYGHGAARVRFGAVLSDRYLAQMTAAAHSMNDISALTDADIAEVAQSRARMDDAQVTLAPLRRFLDLWQALRWIAPLDAPVRKRTWKHAAAVELLSGRYGDDLPRQLDRDALQSDDPAVDERVNALLGECRTLAAREHFLHWEVDFPSIWKNVDSSQPQGGFDAVIGNPPWDRMKLQEVEWFADRRPEIALQARASDRKRMITALKRDGDPLAEDYAEAAQRAEDAVRIARDCGDYPLLAHGDINLYSLFVERAAHLIAPTGVVGLLTPSGIAADLGAAPFFRSIATTGRLGVLFDFENKKVFFPDIHASFKFCALIFSGAGREFAQAHCAFYLHAVAELGDPQRIIDLDAADFAAVNPNTGTAPIFRTRRDAELTTRIYRNHPVLVRKQIETDPLTGKQTILGEERLYPVRYVRMFDMTNDSGLFRRADELRDDGWYPIAGGRWKKGEGEMLPLYEGKMVQMYDHRAASVELNPENLHRPAQPEAATPEQHRDPSWLPTPQAWVTLAEVREQLEENWTLAFKHVTAPTNVRTMIAAACPVAGFGNSLPIFVTGETDAAVRLLANLNSYALDFVCRQKVQGQNLNLYIVEQLPLIDPTRYDETLGTTTIGEFVRNEVLHLSYTANDLADFAHDLGYDGAPFVWDDADRRHRMARLDALYFNLYGLSREEAGYVMDTFPIVRQEDQAEFGSYRTKELVLGYMNALAAGDTTTVLAI